MGGSGTTPLPLPPRSPGAAFGAVARSWPLGGNGRASGSCAPPPQRLGAGAERGRVGWGSRGGSAPGCWVGQSRGAGLMFNAGVTLPVGGVLGSVFGGCREQEMPAQVVWGCAGGIVGSQPAGTPCKALRSPTEPEPAPRCDFSMQIFAKKLLRKRVSFFPFPK